MERGAVHPRTGTRPDIRPPRARRQPHRAQCQHRPWDRRKFQSAYSDPSLVSPSIQAALVPAAKTGALKMDDATWRAIAPTHPIFPDFEGRSRSKWVLSAHIRNLTNYIFQYSRSARIAPTDIRNATARSEPRAGTPGLHHQNL